MSGQLIVALVLAFLVVKFVGRKSGGARTGRMSIPIHGHGTGDRTMLAKHEAGHAAVARSLGGRVTEAWINDDEGWVTAANLPDDPVSMTAFYYGGQIAAGTTHGAKGDNALIDAELRRVPSSQRSKIRAAGKAQARRAVNSSWRLSSDAARLNKRGRL